MKLVTNIQHIADMVFKAGRQQHFHGEGIHFGGVASKFIG